MSRIALALVSHALLGWFGTTVVAAPSPVDTPNRPEQADGTSLVRMLDDPSEKVRLNAVSELRKLARRVDRSGGQRQQHGPNFEPQVPGLVPHLVTAARDKSDTVRIAALYALADSREPAVVQVLRDALTDPSERVRLVAACMLTEFQDASGIAELRKAAKRLQGAPDVSWEFETKLVLASLQGITGKSFGKLPRNPAIESDGRAAEAAKRQYRKLLAAWVAWWEWTPSEK